MISNAKHIKRRLTFICQCIANIFSYCNQQDATFLNLFISIIRSTCFRRVFPSIISSSKLHRYLSDHCCYLLLAASSSNGWTNVWRCMCSFELLMMDGKPRLKHVERLIEINKLRKVASWWLYYENTYIVTIVIPQPKFFSGHNKRKISRKNAEIKKKLYTNSLLLREFMWLEVR